MSFGEITKEKQDEILSDGQMAGLSQEARENLRTEFVSLGGIVKSKPDVSEVRDFTISAILSEDSLSVTLIMMIDGKWFNIGDYTESPDIRDKLKGANFIKFEYDIITENRIRNERINESKTTVQTFKEYAKINEFSQNTLELGLKIIEEIKWT